MKWICDQFKWWKLVDKRAYEGSEVIFFYQLYVLENTCSNTERESNDYIKVMNYSSEQRPT